MNDHVPEDILIELQDAIKNGYRWQWLCTYNQNGEVIKIQAIRHPTWESRP